MSAPQKTLVMGGREWMLLLVLSALWGGSFFSSSVSKVASRSTPHDSYDI
jgi:hypothetical protein